MIKSFIISALLALFLTGCAHAPILGDTVKSEKLSDGIFTGEAKYSFDKAVVEVTIAGGKITKVKILKIRGTKSKKEVSKEIPKRIVDEQSTYVDGISGATTLSRTVMNAAHFAVQKSETQKTSSE
ncbi:MAG: FMN-binding protein [Deltaproteobacteria bacterium]|nr:FMN-binding protein [Deltaproteobacteria bacterium]